MIQVFWVGALALAVFGSLALSLLLHLPLLLLALLIAAQLAVRIAITGREPHQKVMDVGNSALIALWAAFLIY